MHQGRIPELLKVVLQVIVCIRHLINYERTPMIELIISVILFTITIKVVTKKCKQYDLHESKKNLYQFAAISAGFIVFGLITMGIIGMLIFPISNQLILLFYGFDAFTSTHGDSAWPIAFAVAILWPYGFIICHIFNQVIFKTHLNTLHFFLIEIFLHLIVGAGYWVNPEVFDRLFIRELLPANIKVFIWPLIPLCIYLISIWLPKLQQLGKYFLFFFLLIVWENIVSLIAYKMYA